MSKYMSKYILKGHDPIPEPDSRAWSEWFEKADLHVKEDLLDDNVRISTVFLGLDHNFRGGPRPVLFETMIFGGPLGGERHRCCTWDEAVHQHEEMLHRVLRAIREAKS